LSKQCNWGINIIWTFTRTYRTINSCTLSQFLTGCTTALLWFFFFLLFSLISMSIQPLSQFLPSVFKIPLLIWGYPWWRWRSSTSYYLPPTPEPPWLLSCYSLTCLNSRSLSGFFVELTPVCSTHPGSSYFSWAKSPSILINLLR